MATAPLTWTRPLSLDQLRALLRKGNLHPSPGPNLWEKWCVKALSDEALTLVLDLINYEIVNLHFPAYVKPAIMSTIFKRSSRTDLSNYRGITCSKFIKNIPFSWLNHLLSSYITSQCILPETQIVTQPGVQARDLTSFLSQVDAYAHRHNQPFIRVLTTSNLRASMMQFAPMVSHTHSLTLIVPHKREPLLATQVNPDDYDQFRMATYQSHINKPHTPDDHLTLTTLMCEAMDDSLIIRTSMSTSQSAASLAEHFPAAYGWETNWSNSLLYIIDPTDHHLPAQVPMPTVDPSNPDSDNVVWQPIPVATTHFDFLRVMINDPNTQTDKI
ncbi:hypothetical protein PYCCODRAFT_1424907 [Trametes coccinea BRFM310]|uniref:Uncharacterized protein n=1 Tax=Trametes coccinea (strain BRFM310) TaxID=1353009 RepID=A0A1Y2IPG9_TRAC3|nr:hypothetical protein PYCCODRAFT_1424907 [Trametes coccinea BRFM310]